MSQTAPQPKTIYEYASGYCRVLDNHRLVECTLFHYPDGRRTLEEMDCDFGQCPNHIDCIIAKAARKWNSPKQKTPRINAPFCSEDFLLSRTAFSTDLHSGHEDSQNAVPPPTPYISIACLHAL